MTNGTKKDFRKQHEGPLSRLFENFTIDVTFWAVIGFIIGWIIIRNLTRYMAYSRYFM